MPRLNLRNKLLLFSIVIAIIPLVIAGQSLIRIAQDELKSSANDQLVTTARQVVAEIDGLFEHGWLAPLLLVRNAVDGQDLGVQEKVALLRHGIADLRDVVALQLTVTGSRQPLLVTQSEYSRRLMESKVDPLSVLRIAPERIAESSADVQDVRMWIDPVPALDGWLATIVMPLQNPIAGAKAVLSARVNLSRIRASIAAHPFQRTGTIVIVDAKGRQVFDPKQTDLKDRAIVAQAIAVLGSSGSAVLTDRYERPDGETVLGAFAVSRPFEWAVIAEKTERDAYFAVRQMIESLGIWLSIGLLAAAIGAIVFSFRISRPILAIGETATRVGEGDFRARVTNVNSRDEIGDLAARINEMVVHLNERFQLAKFVSGGTMAAIQRSDHEGVKLGGERRTVAILFADIRGYTAFSDGRSPEEVVDVLNLYFQRLADIVTRHKGDIDKYVGDQIMAIFQGEEMAANAVACCLQFDMEMVELRRQHPDWALDIGSGVDLGEVVMGAMGSKNRMDYTVLGDHVNVASRLCSHAAPRQTLVTDRVYEALPGNTRFRFEKLEPIHVKGKSAALMVYDVQRGPTYEPAAEPAQAASA
jgi:adenylate cyclase